MDDLVVNDELTATVVDDESADTTSAIIERLADLVVQTTLVNNWKTLLDIAGLSHADN